MFVEVDQGSLVPPYEQIRGQLATMIASGVLRPGDQLPSIRQLAADLGLAANTVARSYRELEVAGLVQTRVRHGTTVLRQPKPLPRKEIRRQLDEAARVFAAAVRPLGVPVDDVIAAVHRKLDQ